ncbi:hypothetical protein E2C01_043818 [Portunus trituberculatus]|uniref:Uncharacterized protein n=1 Tax=Portunus trituberculatus TaxID=210409 RepID=A0A5B7FQF9_PORTR|nr:hypothetical protein [Portunus trituberculatus]
MSAASFRQGGLEGLAGTGWCWLRPGPRTQPAGGRGRRFSHRVPSSPCRHKHRHKPGGRCIGRQDQYTCGKQMSGEVRGKCCSRSPDTCGSSSSSSGGGGGGGEGRRRRA